MREFVLPDGTVVELCMTGKVNGPGQKTGLCYGTNYPWYRVNGGEWRQSAQRSAMRFAEWCALCETVADFYEGEGGK